jgi:hypothetical protein
MARHTVQLSSGSSARYIPRIPVKVKQEPTDSQGECGVAGKLRDLAESKPATFHHTAGTRTPAQYFEAGQIRK